MSLKTFHLIFVTLLTSLSFGCAAWAFQAGSPLWGLTGIVTGMQVTGVVGAVTPLTIAPTNTTRSATTGVNISSGISSAAGGSGTGTRPPASLAQCRLYSTSIQGRPNVIAVNCPSFTPMRVWRQQVR